MRVVGVTEEDGRRVVDVEDPNPSIWREAEEECVATFWHQATPGTTYWRCLVPARHLPGQSLPFTFNDLAEVDGRPTLLRQRGTAVWQFLGDAHRATIALGQRDLYGTRTLMEVDDNYIKAAPYLRGRKATPWTKTIAESQQPGNSGYSHEMHQKLIPEMDGIICSTDYLGDLYYQHNKNVYVCPNSIDVDDWQYEREEHDAFRIVYYGSPSHVTDAPLVTDALKWASKQPGVEVWTVGFRNPSWSFDYQTVEWTPWLEEARQNLFRFDLGIAPLKGNPWANGKSDIKIMEYAMAGVCPLASDAVPYRTFQHIPDLLIKDGGWMEAIRYFVKNPDAARTRAAEVKDWILRERTIQNTVHLWREAIDG